MEMDDAQCVTIVEDGETKTTEKEVPLGSNKSGRWWKKTQTERHSAIFKVKALKSSWQKKMDDKAVKQNVKKLQDDIRNRIKEEKVQKVERRKEQEKRREENLRKGEIVQVITNTQKLKKIKKKQLRRIEKRDITTA